MSKRGIKLRILFVILAVFTILIFLPNTITAGPDEGSGDPLISGTCYAIIGDDQCIPSSTYFCSGAQAPTCNLGFHPVAYFSGPLYPSCPGYSGCECTCALNSNCVDNDGDGYYAAACAFGTDCDDTNPDIYPDAPELCDGITNQCLGDDGYDLVDRVGSGAGTPVTEECAYNGPSGTKDKGICVAAIRTCEAGGVWGSCQGEVLPEVEDIPSLNCNDNKDNDCDGLTDTDTECGGCDLGDTRPCGTTDVGVCEFGTETCDITGNWGSCTDEITPALESIIEGTCADGLDNDCDAEKDWDTQIWSAGITSGIDDGIVGDNECPVGLTSYFGGIFVNETTPIENSVVLVVCETT